MIIGFRDSSLCLEKLLLLSYISNAKTTDRKGGVSAHKSVCRHTVCLSSGGVSADKMSVVSVIFTNFHWIFINFWWISLIFANFRHLWRLFTSFW